MSHQPSRKQVFDLLDELSELPHNEFPSVILKRNFGISTRLAVEWVRFWREKNIQN